MIPVALRAQAELELRRRKRDGGITSDNGIYRGEACESLISFAKATKPDYQVNWHHGVTARYLDRFARGEIRRLMVFMPPRHGKSELVSRRLPAYILGREPDARLIISSYSADLATAMSRDVQDIIESETYRAVFPDTRLPGKGSRKKATESLFEIEGHRGGIRAAGVGGGVTGMGANYIIIDDPFKDRAEAESETIRRKVYHWYRATLYTRLEKDAGILLTVTRWHNADLAGELVRMMATEGADQWEIVTFPAIAEGDLHPDDPRAPGDALWPDKYNVAALRSIEASLGSYDWNALYQQRPVPASGGLFKRDKFNIIDIEPADIVRKVRFWDLAMSERTSADRTVGVLLGITERGRIVVLDVQLAHIEWDAVPDRVTSTALVDGDKIPVGVEAAFYQTRAVTKLLARPELHRYTVKGYKPETDKFTRALPFAARAGEGMVDVMRRSWTEAFLDEMCSFPLGAHDDIVDATSGAYLMLDTRSRVVTAEVRRWA
jgi:predicted phage terminase large subunit-like protein